MIITKKGPHKGTIIIEEDFRAPKEKVFKAWTTPESLKKWFLAEEKVKVVDVEIKLENEGSYFIEVLYPGYDPSRIEGIFLKVEKPEELEYTWLTPVLEGNTTIVTVTFMAKEKGSKIYLTHGEFKREDQMQMHIDGWKGCLSNLHSFLSE